MTRTYVSYSVVPICPNMHLSTMLQEFSLLLEAACLQDNLCHVASILSASATQGNTITVHLSPTGSQLIMQAHHSQQGLGQGACVRALGCGFNLTSSLTSLLLQPTWLTVSSSALS